MQFLPHCFSGLIEHYKYLLPNPDAQSSSTLHILKFKVSFFFLFFFFFFLTSHILFLSAEASRDLVETCHKNQRSKWFLFLVLLINPFLSTWDWPELITTANFVWLI